MKILVFNTGSRLCLNFVPPPNRPTFLWYWDKYYSHIAKKNYFEFLKEDKYLHFFIIDSTVDGEKLSAMQGNVNFNNVEELYKNKKIGKTFSDAPILRYSENLVPNLVVEFFEDGKAKEVFPSKDEGKVLNFFDTNELPIDFRDVEGIEEVLPEINDCYFPV